MKLRALFWFVLAGVPVAHLAHAQDTDPPNILILLADDMGVDNVGAYGLGGDLLDDSGLSITANIDALAQAGVLFRNAWSNPVCTPTRASMQTGRHTMRTGVGKVINTNSADWALQLGESTLPEILDCGTNGQYANALFGKWHLGNQTVGGDLAPNLAGYDHYAGWLGNFWLDSQWTDSFPKVIDGVRSDVDGIYPTTDKVNDAIAWIGQQSGPWMSLVCFNNPHDPWHAPPAGLHDIDLTGLDPDDDPRPFYKAMVQAMDTEIGRLLNSMPQGVRDNTVVMFLGDNGTHGFVTVAPFNPRHCKGTLYEGGVNVPFIASGPMVPSGSNQESEALIHVTDIMATVADIANVDLATIMPDTVMDSVSFLPHLGNPSLPSTRQYLYTERFGPNGPTTGVPNMPYDFAGTFCQQDIGFGGPGNASLSICGDYFIDNGVVNIDLTQGPANASVLMIFGLRNNPISFAGGTLVPFPWNLTLQAQTDASGAASLSGIQLPAGNYGIDLFAQALIPDAAQSGGFAISNAVHSYFEPTNLKAIRNQDYKLIKIFNGQTPAYVALEEFYDLANDPMEANNLLEPGNDLSPTEQANYDALKAEMISLLSTGGAGSAPMGTSCE